MGRKRIGYSKNGKKPLARRRRWLLASILSVSLVAMLTAWLFWPDRSPLANAPRYEGGPRLVLDRQEIDFGQVRFDKLVQARFRLKNVGDRTLQIATSPRVEAVEGC
jgi:hypothetical protein